MTYFRIYFCWILCSFFHADGCRKVLDPTYLPILICLIIKKLFHFLFNALLEDFSPIWIVACGKTTDRPKMTIWDYTTHMGKIYSRKKIHYMFVCCIEFATLQFRKSPSSLFLLHCNRSIDHCIVAQMIYSGSNNFVI